MEIEEAQQRDTIRKERKKNTEGLTTMKIDPALKSSTGWDTWIIAVKAALTVAYGSKGVPLLYVIRNADASQFVGTTWEELAVNAAPHAGLDYEADRKTVHLFLLNNISEDSDAHAYIQPLIMRNDGRQDWYALNERYENETTVQARANQANQTWEMLVYKNERKKYWRTSHKFGIEIPSSVERAYQIDEDTGTDFWRKAMAKEMLKVKVAYEEQEETPVQIRSGEATRYIGFQEITCHLIWDVKMDLTRKCRMVANGAMTEAPASLTYSSVVSRDSVRLAFLIAELNGLDIMACDVGACLNAPCREKIWFAAGAEHGEKRGKVMVVVRALYGLKSSGATVSSPRGPTFPSKPHDVSDDSDDESDTTYGDVPGLIKREDIVDSSDEDDESE
jgi:hypothetical protein